MRVELKPNIYCHCDKKFFTITIVFSLQVKKRTAERAVLLTELNSVIAHRAVETREREEKALSRVRADPAKQPPIQPNPVSQESVIFIVCFVEARSLGFYTLSTIYPLHYTISCDPSH